MYCTRCGVEIESGLSRCPLCGGEELSADPEFLASFSEYEPIPERIEEARIGRIYRRVLSLFCGTATAVVLITDLIDRTEGLGWSRVAIAGIVAGFLFALFPTLRLRLRLIFALNIATAGALLLAIDHLEDGVVDWFLRIALPILGVLAIILFTSTWALTRVRGVAKPAVVLLGMTILSVTIDLVVRMNTGQPVIPGWSLVVIASALPAVVFLFLLQQTVLREIDLRRRFYL